VAQGRPVFDRGRGFPATILLHAAGMFVIMAVDAEQFPITAVGRIVVVIMIDVVHRELSALFALEFTPASGADRGEKFQGLFPVSRLAFLLLPTHFGDQPVALFIGPVVFCIGHELFRWPPGCRD
jgi:hypothetical protein